LYTFYEVASADLTSQTGKSGRDASIHSNSPDWKNGLGLWLALPNGTEALTSVTHGTVFTPSSFIPRTLQNWTRSAQNAIPCSKLISPDRHSDPHLRQPQRNPPIPHRLHPRPQPHSRRKTPHHRQHSGRPPHNRLGIIHRSAQRRTRIRNAP